MYLVTVATSRYGDSKTQSLIHLCSCVTVYSQYVCYITVVCCNVAITTSYTEEVPFAMEMEPPGAKSE